MRRENHARNLIFPPFIPNSRALSEKGGFMICSAFALEQPDECVLNV